MIFKNKNNPVEKIYQNIIEISRSKFFYIELELAESSGLPLKEIREWLECN